MLTVWYNTVVWRSRYPAVILLVCIVICTLLPKYYKDIISSTLESLEKENFKLYTVLVFPPLLEQQRSTVRRQRHRCRHAFLCWHFPLRGNGPRSAWGGGRRSQPRSRGRKRREGTEQGGGGSSGAGLPHSAGAVHRSPSLDPQLMMDFRWVYRRKKLKQRLQSRWIQMSYCLVSVNGPCAGTSYDLKMNSKQGTSENQSCSSDNQCTWWHFI